MQSFICGYPSMLYLFFITLHFSNILILFKSATYSSSYFCLIRQLSSKAFISVICFRIILASSVSVSPLTEVVFSELSKFPVVLSITVVPDLSVMHLVFKCFDNSFQVLFLLFTTIPYTLGTASLPLLLQVSSYF